MPHPFLKWAGGKGQLVEAIRGHMARAPWSGRYHEPFIGGGALFFALYRTGGLGAGPAVIGDINPNLLDAYRGVQQEPDAVLACLEAHAAAHGKEYFYAVRAEVPEALAERAARIIYLNRTCFNGLYRENSRGLFNVPMGKYKNPRICDAPNLRAASEALNRAEIRQASFEAVLDKARPGDFVYFDPPYHPLSETSSFNSYAKDGFSADAQLALRDVFVELGRRGVYALLSNSWCPFILDAFTRDGVTIHEVQASRAVNSNAEKRGKVSEALIDNYGLVAGIPGNRPGQAVAPLSGDGVT